VHTTAKVHLEKGDAGFAIPRIELVTEAEVPKIDEAAFQQQAETAKKNCPISKLLAAAEITLQAKLLAS
jgi:osmotically inducible protein OsmC